MEVGERTLAIVLWMGGAALPIVLYAPALDLHYRQGIGPILERPLAGAANLVERADRLESWTARFPEDAEALLVSAAIDRSTGRTASAREKLVRANKIRPNWHKPLVNLATLDYLEGSTPNAIAHLQQAIAFAPSAVRPQFNLGKIYYKETRLDEGLAALKKAKNADPSSFAALEGISVDTDPNRILIDEKIEAQELIPRIWGVTKEVTAIRDRIHQNLFPALPPLLYWIVLGVVFIGTIVLSMARKTRRLPRACTKCGIPSCGLCDPAIERESLCVQCYHIFVRLEMVEPQARRRKDREIARHRFLRDVRERWSGMLIPGYHALFRGTYIRGALLLLLGSALVMPVACPMAFVSSPYSLSGLPLFPSAIMAAVGLGLIYVLSILDAVRS
jgi:tetratricopeptide (TPR) repeat protein